jgi:membrane associated rhomboid family serine protease
VEKSLLKPNVDRGGGVNSAEAVAAVIVAVVIAVVFHPAKEKRQQKRMLTAFCRMRK